MNRREKMTKLWNTVLYIGITFVTAGVIIVIYSIVGLLS